MRPLWSASLNEANNFSNCSSYNLLITFKDTNFWPTGEKLLFLVEKKEWKRWEERAHTSNVTPPRSGKRTFPSFLFVLSFDKREGMLD